MVKKSLACCVLLGVVCLALASSGGGKAKSKSSLESGFAPKSSYSGFSLKAGPRYSGSQIFSAQRTGNQVLFNSVVTYQRGNTVYILPYRFKLNASKPAYKTNLNLIDLKFRLPR